MCNAKVSRASRNVPFNRHVVVVVGGDDDDDDDDDNIGFNILRCRRPDLSEIQPTCGTTLLLKTAEKIEGR